MQLNLFSKQLFKEDFTHFRRLKAIAVTEDTGALSSNTLCNLIIIITNNLFILIPYIILRCLAYGKQHPIISKTRKIKKM